jgi:hypothetical protein
MPSPDSTVLEARNAAGDGLRATFFWRVDRYAHRIERLENGVAITLLESIEGSELDRWPPSPPLQQLHVESLADGRDVALLVGMAGESHWSLSAEREPGAEALVFDVACRVKNQNPQLGSAYRSLVRQELREGLARLHRPGGQGAPAILELIPLPNVQNPAPHVLVDGRGVSLSFAGPIDPPQTVRWKYRLRLG